MNRIPNPDTVFPNEYGTSCFLKNVITAPNIFVGDYTYYDDPAAPADFEKNNVLFNGPNSATDSSSGSSAALRAARASLWAARTTGCAASPLTHSMYSAAHGLKVRRRTCPSSHSKAIPLWAAMYGWGGNAPSCPGVKIGDGAIVAAYSVVTRNVDPYTVVGGNPARLLKHRFDAELTGLLLQFRWWDLPAQQVTELLPLLCDPDLEHVRKTLRALLQTETERPHIL